MLSDPLFLKELYCMMLRIRLIEERFVDPILDGTVRCPVHLYSGQEAVAAGLGANLLPGDQVFGNHRSHGHYLVRGGDLKKMAAEVYCRETGCSRGRGGSMHLIDIEKGFLGAAPIVAGTISLALGAALASYVRDDGRVTISFFGDGATGEGVLYESLNFAAINKLPLIFACENNLYSTHLPIREIRVDVPIADAARPFGVHTARVDGNDVLAVYEAAKEAFERCRSGNGPVFLEFLTYRMRGHVGPDDNVQGSHTNIRPKEEVDAWMKKDPIVQFEGYLLRQDGFSRQSLDLLRQEVEQEVEEAIGYAAGSLRPASDEVMNYVFRKKT